MECPGDPFSPAWAMALRAVARAFFRTLYAAICKPGDDNDDDQDTETLMSEPTMKQPQTLLRFLLFAHSLPEHEIAALLGISASCLSRIAAAKLKTPKALRAAAQYFSKLLGVPISETLLTQTVSPFALVGTADKLLAHSLLGDKV
jgi:hypothetical protein